MLNFYSRCILYIYRDFIVELNKHKPKECEFKTLMFTRIREMFVLNLIRDTTKKVFVLGNNINSIITQIVQYLYYNMAT